MPNIDVTGIEEFTRKVRRLDDKMTRREVLKVQRRSAKPIVARFSSILPRGSRVHSRKTKSKGNEEATKTTYQPGNLKKSVKAETVPASKVGGNPSIVIRPSIKGNADGYYRFMVVEQGTKLVSTKRGSRIGKNTVVSKARNKTAQSMNSLATRDYQNKMAKMLQRQIDKL